MEKYIINCKYYIEGNCNWSELGRKESRCICIPEEIDYKKKPEECFVRKILDSLLEKKL
jgi:hypothetical protein